MQKAKSGTTCTIKVKTTENSHVSLLAVDESVKLTGTGNDVDNARVAAEMNILNTFKTDKKLVINGNSERYMDFGDSNTFILTNALSGKESCGKGRNKRSADSEEEEFNTNNLRVRKNLPESWIFEDFEVDSKGEFTLIKTVPDSITSFSISGFSVHPVNGLAVAAPQKLTVFQDFLVKVYLPFSVSVGEVVRVDVAVFNFIENPNKAVNTDVKLFNTNNEFAFVDAKIVRKECKISPSDDRHRTRSILVPSENGASTFFLIRALAPGQIKIRVKVSTSSREDEVEQMMLVENKKTSNSPVGKKPCEF